MEHDTLVHCTECEKAYVVQKRRDGGYVLTTDDGKCTCGNDMFREVEAPTDD